MTEMEMEKSTVRLHEGALRVASTTPQEQKSNSNIMVYVCSEVKEGCIRVFVCHPNMIVPEHRIQLKILAVQI